MQNFFKVKNFSTVAWWYNWGIEHSLRLREKEKYLLLMRYDWTIPYLVTMLKSADMKWLEKIEIEMEETKQSIGGTMLNEIT